MAQPRFGPDNLARSAAPAKAPATVALLPAEPGVYRFRGESGVTLYIGRSANLRARVASYWGDLGDRKRLARMVPQIARLEAVACSSAHEAAWLERNLLERRRPRWNRAIGGQEVPVFIRLDCGPRSTGVTMVHEAKPSLVTRHFGPYLGGTKVRLAVTSLNRMFPLAYASGGLAGSGRDMAPVLGAGMSRPRPPATSTSGAATPSWRPASVPRSLEQDAASRPASGRPPRR